MSEVKIHEVGLRDGLQMEKHIVPTEQKISLIDKLVGSGIKMIQVGSFVHPKYVPQMADTDELFNIVKRHGDVVFSGLVLNEKGMERAFACNVDLICMGVSASQTHSMKNTKMSVEEAQERIIKMAKECMNAKKPVQVSVQSAFGCGFEGKIEEGFVLQIISRYLNAGITKISLADTAGHSYPGQVVSMMEKIKNTAPDVEIACHFHNTYGLGMACCYAALQSGADYLESAVGGLGGCPFTKLASGNVCTEDLVHYLHRNGMNMDIDLSMLVDTAKNLSLILGKELPGYVYQSGGLKY